MNPTPRPLRLLLSCLALTGAALAADREGSAQPYAPGDAFAAFSTRDQHDKPFVYEGGARRIVVSFEMDTGKAANGFLEKQGADYLARKQTLFIANIHGMPGIARTFAMPKMRRYPHRIILADAEHFLDRYPSKDNHLTVISLDEKSVVTSVGFVPKKDAAKAFE